MKPEEVNHLLQQNIYKICVEICKFSIVSNGIRLEGQCQLYMFLTLLSDIVPSHPPYSRSLLSSARQRACCCCYRTNPRTL